MFTPVIGGVHDVNRCLACLASADIDAERSRLYLDLVRISLAQNAPEAFEATMNSLGYEYQSDFARRKGRGPSAQITCCRKCGLRGTPLLGDRAEG